MANEEHVKIVKQGAAAIAKWRRAHPKERLDLSDADLSGVHLSKADLSVADLRGVDLSRAGLFRADLNMANLCGARLTNADLERADLSGANLYGADLSEARLVGADLSEANLCGVNVQNARLGTTAFVNVDLSEVRGLESVEHLWPSSVGVDTLFKSKGKIPEEFLRGCGVPDALIEYLPSLIGSTEPVQFYSCVISHSSKDEEFCRRLYSRMRDEKLRVWYAPEDLKGGEKLYDQIEHAIRFYDKLLLVLSEHSMRSDWVETEIRLARKREKAENRHILFPIMLTDFDTLREWTCFDADTGRDLAVEVREYFIPDFSDWRDHDAFEKAFAGLMEDLKAEGAPGRHATEEA